MQILEASPDIAGEEFVSITLKNRLGMSLYRTYNFRKKINQINKWSKVWRISFRIQWTHWIDIRECLITYIIGTKYTQRNIWRECDNINGKRLFLIIFYDTSLSEVKNKVMKI